ncbi:MAG: hypothetical protein HQL72_14350 [Magnetococcales bacterium]|nr:hypothetical protein [Magnetococcales bacterium]
MEKKTIHLLISRGLDGDLNREEMVKLYRLVANDPSLTVEMGELARLQEELLTLSQLTSEQTPTTDLAARMAATIQKEQQKKISFFALTQRLHQWLLSPKGLAVQPLSFAGGILASLLVVWLTAPGMNLPLDNNPTLQTARLNIHDVQFVKAKARISWTNQFIIPPGGSTRLALDQGQEPVQIQFETVEPTRLTVTHTSLKRGEEAVRTFVVTGIGYATLRQPHTGDAVGIENSGQVPVLVYMRNAGGVTVSDFTARNMSQSL